MQQGFFSLSSLALRYTLFSHCKQLEKKQNTIAQGKKYYVDTGPNFHKTMS